jgi:hypothetical protein
MKYQLLLFYYNKILDFLTHPVFFSRAMYVQLPNKIIIVISSIIRNTRIQLQQST